MSELIEFVKNPGWKDYVRQIVTKSVVSNVGRTYFPLHSKQDPETKFFAQIGLKRMDANLSNIFIKPFKLWKIPNPDILKVIITKRVNK